MAAESRIPISSDADIVEARQAGRALAAELGFSAVDQTMIATAISELARNIMQYARRGEVTIGTAKKENRTGLFIEARDDGPGIPDIGQAMQEGFSTGHGLGMGLPGTRRLMDEFEIESEPGRGTRVTMRKWLPRSD